MKTKTYSTQQSKSPLTGQTGLIISSGPCNIIDIEGFCNGTAGTVYFLQLLGVLPVGAVSGTTIPLWSRAVTGGQGFSFTYRPDGISTDTLANPPGGTLATTGANTLPIAAMISSTDTVWTSVAASTDVSVEVEETNNEYTNQTIVGDTTTGRDSLTVFADPSTPNFLTQVVVTNNSASPTWLMIFAAAAPANGSYPVKSIEVLTGQTLILNFGQTAVLSQDANGTNHNGCYLVGSSTGTTLTATVSSNWTMQAFYI